MTFRSRHAMCKTGSMPTSRWIAAAIASADIRAEALGPSGMLMASTPKWKSLRAFSISFAGDMPFGETSSTSVTNSLRRSLFDRRDFSPMP